MKFAALFVLALFSFLPTAVAEEETPQEGLQAIADLYESKDYEKLIRERYTEIYKAEAEGKVDKLIEHFSKRFANDKRRLQVLKMYQGFLEIEPEIVANPKPRETETKIMAIFKTEMGPYILYLQKTGKWGFHM